MKNKDAKLLVEFLDHSARPDDTLRFHELQGFLFAVASSPDTVMPSEWVPMIGNEESLGYRDENEAQKILGLVMLMYNEINSGVLERSNALPPGCALADDIAGNFGDDVPVSQWSRGFAYGHDWLVEGWESYLFDEVDEECGATLMVLSFFGSRQLAEAYHAEMGPARNRKGDASFDEFAQTMRRMFPDALASYANLGRTIFEVVASRGADESEPVKSTRIGRNEPCPCGSGRKYKKCCGAQLH